MNKYSIDLLEIISATAYDVSMTSIAGCIAIAVALIVVSKLSDILD